ncbi:winged helix-turn-helix transcriptional regulator [Puteibacter caeruleilacunae]|nr:winged helix-turn-helix transcriptional regulator [Puteibacter caeruleilacunae]
MSGENVGRNVGENTSVSGETSGKILELIQRNMKISIPEMAEEIGISERSIERNLEILRKEGKLKRIGPAKGGHWKIIE